VHYDDCQRKLDGGSDYDLAENEFLKANNLNPIDFNLILKTINTRVSHLRAKLIWQQKILMCYILLGGFILSITCCLFGILVTYWVSIVEALLYFIGLAFVISYTTKQSKGIEKDLHINLSVMLLNYTREFLKPTFNIEARIGHCSQWVEFHSIKVGDLDRKPSRLIDDLEEGPNQSLLEGSEHL
jgi:hypothetical protein